MLLFRSCREIGAGSAPAAAGQYFSTHAPLVGRLPDDAKSLVGFEGVEGIEFVARERDGSVVDAAAEMDSFVNDSLSKDKYPIAHGVFGGKTGLRCDKMPESMEAGEKSLGVVDACQARFSQDELKEWLDQDSLVLFTASKFYQAPPFCGAVIVPPRIAQKLRESPPPGPKEMFGLDGLGGFLTEKEIPEALNHWKPLLRKQGGNLGLALRWEAGLAGMEALAHVPDNMRTKAINEWAESVSNMVAEETMLDAWVVERSIVSIRVAAKGDGSAWRSMSELRDLYRWMSMDVSSCVPGATADEQRALAKPAYIGQPVDVSESHAIVRIALGVDSLVSYLDNNQKDATLAEDQHAVKKLAAIAKHFDTLKQSGY